ncbi:Fe(3+)-citrate-binding protein YfmC [Acrocarpospora phusangensis]|uniref:Fe(3+)-citrate-binding protein YfmC n=1 Tax=Acrocarpospora phusangensis TaxID=1070424 RepID=A0A919Q5Q7_9ACTN|nr:ABC transporter substrate-binding protein [Acrocarpospora phusangensis]GIH22646.1 Fe(3+)-citrate-binding protein YfmC [Acrocarpospora phusangensis]
MQHPPRQDSRSWRTLVATIATLLLGATVLAGCGGDSSGAASAGPTHTITHVLGTTEVGAKPQRVVALEYSFVQALDLLGVTPVGIADDESAERIQQLLDKKIEYTSVGTRLEPNLELVSSLKPDLIIADSTRHAKIYKQLGSIAPTIVLNSWEGSYQEIKDAVVTIGEALGDRETGVQAVKKHEQTMADLAAKIPADEKRTFMLAVSTPDSMTLHTAASFTGSVFQTLGLTPAVQATDPTESGAGLERVAAVNPGVLLIATDGAGTAYDQWKDTATWKGVAAERDKQVYVVDRNQFSRFRGLGTAEVIAQTILRNVYGDA